MALSEGKGMLLMEYMAGRDLGTALAARNPADGSRLFGWWQVGGGAGGERGALARACMAALEPLAAAGA